MKSADGATDVSTDAAPVLAFSDRIVSYSVRLYEADTQAEVSAEIGLDLTGKAMTITPDSLEAGTRYSVVIVYVKDGMGRVIKDVVFGFTTEAGA